MNKYWSIILILFSANLLAQEIKYCQNRRYDMEPYCQEGKAWELASKHHLFNNVERLFYLLPGQSMDIWLHNSSSCQKVINTRPLAGLAIPVGILADWSGFKQAFNPTKFEVALDVCSPDVMEAVCNDPGPTDCQQAIIPGPNSYLSPSDPNYDPNHQVCDGRMTDEYKWEYVAYQMKNANWFGYCMGIVEEMRDGSPPQLCRDCFASNTTGGSTTGEPTTGGTVGGYSGGNDGGGSGGGTTGNPPQPIYESRGGGGSKGSRTGN